MESGLRDRVEQRLGSPQFAFLTRHLADYIDSLPSEHQAQLTQVEQEIAHLIEALKQRMVTVSTKAELAKLEGEQQRLQQMLERSSPKTGQVADFVPDLVRRFKTVLEELATVTQHSIDKARGSLRDLMGAQIFCIPQQTELIAI